MVPKQSYYLMPFRACNKYVSADYKLELKLNFKKESSLLANLYIEKIIILFLAYPLVLFEKDAL